MMLVARSSFLVLLLSPLVAGQGRLRGNADQDAAPLSSTLDKAIDEVTSNIVPSNDDSGSTDAQTYEDMLATSDNPSDAEVRSDLKSEASDLRDVLAEGNEDVPVAAQSKKDGSESSTELEDNVDELEGEVNRRNDDAAQKWRAEAKADAADSGINGDIALAQGSGNDDEGDDETAESDHEADEENAQANHQDNVPSLLQDSEQLYDDHDLLQEAHDLEKALSSRRDEQGKDNANLEKMVHNLIDETKAAQKAHPSAPEPEVIMVLLQTIKKHATMFGGKYSRDLGKSKAKHTSIWDSNEEESAADIAEEDSIEEGSDSSSAEEDSSGESDEDSDDTESDAESDEEESDSESTGAESDAESDEIEDDDSGASEDQGEDSADEELADADEEQSADDSADVESEVDVDASGEVEDEMSDTNEEEVQDDAESDEDSL